jgi:hypothetical protein
LEDRSSTPLTWSSTSDLNKSTSNFLKKRYVVISIVIVLMSSRRRTALGDVDHLTIKKINPDRMNGKVKRLKNLWRMNPLYQSQAHGPSRYGKKRWHHHHHKKYSHLDLHHWDRMMQLKSEGLALAKSYPEDLKIRALAKR